MSTHTRRSISEVLRDRRAISVSMPELMTSTFLKFTTIGLTTGLVVAGIIFGVVTVSNTSTSGGFQNANAMFEKSISTSDMVVGYGTNRINILTDVDGGRCQVQTWQGHLADGSRSLQVDTATVNEACTATIAPRRALMNDDSLALVRDVENPAFVYSNAGGRAITYSSAGAATLASGVKPDGVKQGDWDDVRPYKVVLSLASANADTVEAATKAVATGHTDVVNVTPAADSIRYVPTPGTDPIPGPIEITDVRRSSTEGTTIAGVREGITVTIGGAVCASGPTTLNVSYTQQAPTTAPTVNTVRSLTLTGQTTTVDLGGVPNGSTGTVEAAASCIEGGAVEKASTAFTQAVPRPTLTVKLNSDPNKHDLSWAAVSSLPTTFELGWAVGGRTDADIRPLTTTDKLAYTSTMRPGENLGMTTMYQLVAKVDTVTSPKHEQTIHNEWPKTPASTVSPRFNGATWAAITCPTGSYAEYSYRYRQQSQSSTGSWTAMSAWATTRTLTGVTTAEYGRTLYEVDSRCRADGPFRTSTPERSAQNGYYVPEAMQMSVARSTTAGEMIGGVREGAQFIYTGARCYADVPTQLQASSHAYETGHSELSDTTRVMPAGTKTIDFPGIPNGSEAEVEAYANCAGVPSDSVGGLVFYEQPLPTPVLTVAQGANANQHVVSWNKVSSLPTNFRVFKTADKGSENANPPVTTALSQTLNYAAGTNYGNKTDYVVDAEAGVSGARTTAKSITTPWPTIPSGTSIGYTRTGLHNHYPYGRINWNHTASCPSGTTLESKMLENRHGRDNGTFETDVKSQTPWIANLRQTDWGPGSANQGYAYGVGIQTKCKSNVTAIESSVTTAQSNNFVIPMATPAQSRFDGYNFRENRRGTNWTYSTCTATTSACHSMVVDWTTSCARGSWVNWSDYFVISWSNTRYHHAYGWRDNWELPNGGHQWVYYQGAQYTCATPWATSPRSPVSGVHAFEVRR